mgnify:CR=1 FL=1
MRAILEAAVRPEGRLLLGAALQEIGRKHDITHADIEAIAQGRRGSFGGETRMEMFTFSAEEAEAHMVAIKGIGPWTARIYLLFCLGHSDAFPAGDLALQEAVRMGFDLPERPDAKAIEIFAERWRPWRGVAAKLLWNYYGAMKSGKEAIPAGGE